MSSFLNSGKNIYVEGYNFAEDHQESDFFNLLGCEYISDGNELGDIFSLYGYPGTFVQNITFEYGYLPSPKCRADIIEAEDGQLLFNSQDTLGYAVAFDNGNYKVITSTFLLGALIDGIEQNTKVELMNRYLQYFEGTLSAEEINSIYSKPSGFSLSQNYPNPFKQRTLIKFNLLKNTDHFSLSIFNMLGQEVKRIRFINGFDGNYSLIWDGTDNGNVILPSGTYIYQLKVGDRSISKKMNLLR